MKKTKIFNKDKIDHVEGDRIILNGRGYFPKNLIIYDDSKISKYRIVKTKKGKYQLNK